MTTFLRIIAATLLASLAGADDSQARSLCPRLLSSSAGATFLSFQSDQLAQISMAHRRLAQLQRKLSDRGAPASTSYLIRATLFEPSLFRGKLRDLESRLLSEDPSALAKELTNLNSTCEAMSEATARIGPYVFPDRPSGIWLTPPTSMAELERYFDVVSRQAGRDPKTVHEVDAAFLQEGMPFRRIILSADGTSRVDRHLLKDKVFALGHTDAVAFDGARTATLPERRFYALVFPKGFIARFGGHVEKSESSRWTHIPGTPLDLSNRTGQTGKLFVVRKESNPMRAGHRGQVHFFSSWIVELAPGEFITAQEFIQRHVIGVVEFDRDGVVLSFKEPAR